MANPSLAPNALAITQRDIERLWASASVGSQDECWPWRKSKWHNGYGVFRLGNRRRAAAHRVAFIVAGGVIPAGYDIDHLCRNRGCVNPIHLEAVTRRENLQRSPFTLSGRGIRTTHCPKGHELTPENTDIRIKNGAKHRQCALCKKLRRQGTCDHCGRFFQRLKDHLVCKTRAV